MVRTNAIGKPSRAPRALLRAWAFGLVLALVPAASAAPPAGTPIDNTAYASGRDSTGGSPVLGRSNTVRALVQVLEGVSLWPDHRVTAAPGATVTFAHRLLNRGNFTGSFEIEAVDLGADQFDFGAFTIVHDLDRDGLALPGDPLVPSGGTLAIAAGDSADLLVTVRVPASGLGLGRLSLRATSLAQSVTSSVLDSVFAGDPAASVVLFAEKTASRAVVEWGDELDYRVRVANRSDTALAAVTLDDVLPPGFVYVRGTARLAGAPAPDPAGTPGAALLHALGDLGPRAETEIAYRVRVGPGAPAGDARSAAVANAGSARSNVALAVVRVQGDAFADEAMVSGTVFYDADGDGRRSPGEPGLGGVRLYADDGTFAVTDEEGRYTLTGLTPRTHALKVDRRTLPPAAVIAETDLRSRGLPGVRFVDLVRGQYARADFAAVGDSSLRREADERRGVLSKRGADERARVLGRGTGVLAADRARPDPRSLPASRIVTGESELPIVKGAAVPPAGPEPVATHAAFDPAALDGMLANLDSELGFVGLADQDTVAFTQIPVVVKGRHGTRLQLRVNGELLPESRVGRRHSVPRQGLEVWEYVGVALRPGVNVLEVSPPRSVGRLALRLVAPGPLARLELEAPRDVPADGHGTAMLLLRTVDVAGVPVGEHTLVTLDAGGAKLAAADLDPSTPGVQVAVTGGALRVPVFAPATPGIVRVTATAGAARAVAAIEFVPDLRPLIAVGSLEGIVSLRRFGGSNARGARSADASFEAPIAQFANESRDGEAAAAAHGAFFLKGRVRKSLLLTAGWDSDRPRDQRQFRDLQPDRGFPVVGDASARGWEAQSTGQIYVRVEQREASLLFGDFVTGGAGARSLGNYSRSLTGSTARWGNARASLGAFTSRARSARVVDELRGEGTSGPYRLTRLPMIENSERVELVVRDRAQPALVHSAKALQRFTDYEIEPLTGRLLLRAPVPSLDADLNPVFVRVTYEVTGGVPAWVHGAEGRVRLSPRLDVGGSYVDDHDPAAPFELRSASATARLPLGATLETEWASTRRPGGTIGDAGRFELQREGDRFQARLWGAAGSRGFDNPGAGLSGGRSEAGARWSAKLARRTRLNGEGLFSAGADGRERREGFLLALDRTLSKAWRGELGVRWSRARESSAPSEPAGASVRARLAAQWPKRPEWSGWAEVEQDTREADRRMAALGGEYRFASRGRLYARHELISSFASAWALSGTQRQAATLVGVDADLARDAHLFSEYRLGDAFGGREAQAAVGLRNGWKLASGMRVGTTFERVTPLRGADRGASTALTGSVDWTEDPAWKGSSRAEVRTNRSADQFLQSMAAAVKLDSAWTGLGRHLLTLERRHGRGGDARERLQLALAYRPGGAWDALGRWELRYDREAPDGGARVRRLAHIAGFAANGRTGPFEGSLAWSGKLTRVESAGLVTAGGAQWLHGRLGRDLGREWDCGLTASVLAGRRFAQRRYGLGAEAGRLLPGGAWLSLGFNRFGYADDELTGEQWTRTGAYLRMRVKFDETLFQRDEVRR